MSNEMWSLALEDDAGTAKWTSCAPLPGVPRAFPVLVRCGSFLYLLGGVSLWNPLTPLKDAYRYDAAADAWERLPDLPVAGYAWSAEAVDPHHVLLAGRADGEIHPEIWLLDIRNMAARTMGNAVIQTTTAALVRVNPQEWWLVGGEPDAQKTRTDRVTVIRMHPRRG